MAALPTGSSHCPLLHSTHHVQKGASSGAALQEVPSAAESDPQGDDDEKSCTYLNKISSICLCQRLFLMEFLLNFLDVV